MQNLLLVAVGGGAGAVMRYLLGVQTMRAFGTGWPYGTLAANVVGGLLMGVLIGTLAFRGGADQERWRLLLGVGGLGGFTTFSAWQLEAVLCVRQRGFTQAPVWILFGSLGAGFASCWLGYLVGDRVRFG